MRCTVTGVASIRSCLRWRARSVLLHPASPAKTILPDGNQCGIACASLGRVARTSCPKDAGQTRFGSSIPELPTGQAHRKPATETSIRKRSTLQTRFCRLAATALALFGIAGANLEIGLSETHDGSTQSASVSMRADPATESGNQQDKSTGSQPTAPVLHVDHCGHAHCVTGGEFARTLLVPMPDRVRIDTEPSMLRSIAGPPQLRPPIA